MRYRKNLNLSSSYDFTQRFRGIKSPFQLFFIPSVSILGFSKGLGFGTQFKKSFGYLPYRGRNNSILYYRSLRSKSFFFFLADTLFVNLSFGNRLDIKVGSFKIETFPFIFIPGRYLAKKLYRPRSVRSILNEVEQSG